MKNKNIILKAIILILALMGISLSVWVMFNHKSSNEKEPEEETNTDTSTLVCETDEFNTDALGKLDTESKTETIHAIGGESTLYNVTTTVTKEHDYTSDPEYFELYTNDSSGTLFVLYDNTLYYTNETEIINNYCETSEENGLILLTCDYSKFNSDIGLDFAILSINEELKAIGTYDNSGSGAPTLYGITTDGRVISIIDYSGCIVIYDNPEYPIDRIFNMHLYDGKEYTILLKDGTLITRDVDRENPIQEEQ